MVQRESPNNFPTNSNKSISSAEISDVSETPTPDWPYPPPGETSTVEPTITETLETPSPETTLTVTPTLSITPTGIIPPAANEITLTIDAHHYKPGDVLQISWKIRTTDGNEPGEDWKLQISLPSGWEPTDIGAGIFDPQTGQLTFPVTTLQGKISINTRLDTGDTEIVAVLTDGNVALIDTILPLRAKITATIKKDGGEIYGKIGKVNVKIKFPKDALPEDAEISMQTPEDMHTSLPLRGKHPLEFIAIGKTTHNSIHQFVGSVDIQVTYDPADIDIHPSTLSLYWFDTETGAWRVVSSQVNEETNTLFASVDHFSLFSLGQNSWEAMKLPPLDAAQVSTYTGSAAYNLPIEVPSGPGGIAPSISLSYDSTSVEGITNEKAMVGNAATTSGTQTSWVGAGWSLSSGGYIMRNMGYDIDWDGDDTYSLVIGGMSMRLIPVSHSTTLTDETGYIDYKASDENFWLIRRYKIQGTQTYNNHYLSTTTLYNATSENDKWVVWDKTGTRYTFGSTLETRSYYVETYRDNEAAPGSLCQLATNRICVFRPWGWHLYEIKYPSGKSLTFSYSKERDQKCYGDLSGSGSTYKCKFYAYADQAMYPNEIVYPDNGKTRIVFIPENREDYLWYYGDLGTKIRYEKKRLQSIQVKVDGTIIREYRLNYFSSTTTPFPIFPESKWTPVDPSINSGITDNKRMAVLEKVTQYGVGGVAGGQAIPGIQFSYGQITLNETTYNAGNQMHLSQVNNGQGGSVTFVYEASPWGATNGGETQKADLYTGSDFSLERVNVEPFLGADKKIDAEPLPVMPGVRYRFSCKVKSNPPAPETKIRFKILYRYNDENTDVRSADLPVSTYLEDVVGYIDLPMNANRITPQVQLADISDNADRVYLNNCTGVPVTTYRRVSQRIVADSVTTPGQIITYPFSYTYEGAAVNDTTTLVTVNGVQRYISENARLGTTLRSGLSEPNTEFRGHSKVTVTDPYGLKTETLFYQDDILKGKTYSVKQLDGNQGNLLLSWAKSYWPDQPQTISDGLDGHICSQRYSGAGCYQDQKVYWVYSDWDENRDYGPGVTSDTSGSFAGVRKEYYFAPKEKWGNLIGVIERFWDGSQWISDRLIRTTYSDQGVYSDGGANVDTTKYLVGLPGSINLYKCPDGNCSFTYQIGTLAYSYPPIENLVSSTCNLYETPTDANGGTAVCSILKSGSSTIETVDVPDTGLLTGKRTLLQFGDGISPDYTAPHYSDELYIYDAWGNQVKRIVNPKEGAASARADPAYNRATIWEYDTTFYARLTKEKNTLNQTTEYRYEETITPTGGSPIATGGYYLGLPTTEIDPNGAYAYAQYDAFGRMKTLILPGDTSSSPTIQAGYYVGSSTSPAWMVISQKTAAGNGVASRKIFDGLGRLIQTQTAGAAANNDLLDIVTQMAYDAYGRITKKTAPTGLADWNPYAEVPGPVYRPLTFAGDHSNFTSTAYDVAGRIENVVAPDLTATIYAYSIQSPNLLSTITDAKGNQTTRYTNAFGQLTSVDAPSGPNVSYQYYASGLLSSATYGNETSGFSYDLAGRKISLDDPDMGEWQYAYDALGSLTRQEDAKHQVNCLYYDALNRLIGKNYQGETACPTSPSAFSVNYTYDAYGPGNSDNKGIGRRTGMTVRSGNPADPNNQPYMSVVWEYDHRGRVTHEARLVKDTLNTPDIWSDDLSLGTYHTYWSYNPDNSVEQIVYPNMETVNFRYLPQGTIDQVFSIQNEETSDLTQYYIQKTAYDEAGRVSERTLGNNLLQTQYDYFDWFDPNGQGRLSSIKTIRLADNNSLQDLRYVDAQTGPDEPGYDAVGNLRYIEDATSQQRQTYGYDALNRLISANVTGQGEGLYSVTYGYDPSTGNLSQKDGIAYTYDLQHPHAVKKLDGVDKYGYDANGSMTSRVVDGITYTLTYDMENRLTAITGGSVSARYLYDGDGKRALSVVGDTRTLYIGDYFEAQIGPSAPPAVQPPTLTNYSMCHDNRCARVFLPAIFSDTTPVPPLGMTQGNFGNTYYHTHAGTPPTGVKWLTFYSGGGAQVAVREKNGSSDFVSYLLQDHLGSTTQAVDSQGVVTATMLYKAWGETRVPSGSTPAMPTMRRYTGQYEAEAGLYFYGARFYDPSLGKFAQADTIVPEPGDPVSWDRYAYVRNSPLGYSDPSGHFPWIPVIIGGAILIGGGIYAYTRYQEQKAINNDPVLNRQTRDQIGGALVTELSAVVNEKAASHDVSPTLINAVIRHESGAGERRLFGVLANAAEYSEAMVRSFTDRGASIGIGQLQTGLAKELEQKGYANIPGKHDIPASLLTPSTAVEYIAGNLQYISDNLKSTYGDTFTSQDLDTQYRLILIGYNQGWEKLHTKINKLGLRGTIEDTGYDNQTLDDYNRWKGMR